MSTFEKGWLVTVVTGSQITFAPVGQIFSRSLESIQQDLPFPLP